MERRQILQDERSPSARNLVLVFLASVAVCAVFFSLGFLIGYNQRESKQAPISESVPVASEIPPPVNAPAQAAAPAAEESSETSASSAPGTQAAPPAVTPQPLEAEPTPAVSEAPAKAATRRIARVKHPEQPSKPATARQQAGGGTTSAYSVQVLAARTQTDANSLASLLKSRGYPAFVLSPQEIGASDNYFRVLVGPYTNRAAAQRIRDKLEKEGFKPFIKH